MHKMILAALLATAAGVPAQGATLTHSYEFNGNSAVDGTGSLNGTLIGGATVSGGTLNLNGTSSYVDLGGKALDLTQAYSVFIRYAATGQNSGITEMVSQGYSGQPGFYLGTIGTDTRVTDYASGGIGHTLPQDGLFHNLLFTTGSGTQVIIDGTIVYSTATNFTPGNNGGANTGFGNQFGNGYGEFFKGQIDRAKFYSGIATYAEAIAGPAGVPEPAAWALMIGGLGVIGAAARRRRSATVTA